MSWLDVKAPGFHVTCKRALFFYLTMSVVDKCGFISNFFKMFPLWGSIELSRKSKMF